MANDVSNLNRQHWAKKVQAELEESLICMDLANTQFKDQLKDGTTVNFPTVGRMAVGSYTKYTNVTAQDIKTTNETLVINQTPMVMFSYDEVDAIENYLDVVSVQMSRNVFTLKQYIEGKFFAEYANATYNSGSAVALTTAVADATYPGAVFGLGRATLGNNGVDTSKLVLVVDEFQALKIAVSAAATGFNTSDESIRRGFIGTYMGMDVYTSNNLSFTATLDLATQPALNDTVRINGVTFTFVTTLGTTAGNVLRGADAAAAMTNLISAINGTAGAGTTYVDVGSDIRNKKLIGISAAQGTNQVLLTSIHGYRPVSTPTMTTAANDWKDAIIHCLVMEKGAINLVMQKEVSVTEREEPLKLVKNYFVWTKFGIKTFTEGAERIYDVRLLAQADEA